MIIPAPISFCLICRNDQSTIEQCLTSIRPYVEEIVVIDTGSTDDTPNIAKKYADIFEIYTGCNNPDTGLIESFADARNYSLSKATKPMVAWADADDILEGLNNINKYYEQWKENNTLAFLFPYEYAYNAQGQCTCRHYRERLFPRNTVHFVNPVHEVAVPNDNTTINFITVDDIIYKHRRQFSNKKVEPGRNLRILRNYFEKHGDSDARQLYYLGLECCNSGLIEEAIQHLSKYVEVSGWDDERTMACLKLIDIYQATGNYQEGLKWAFKTIELKETWGEGYFALGKMFYFLAQNNPANEARNWERSVYFTKIGLSLPPTKTLLFINPLDRDYDIHRYYNIALNKTGDIKGALESVNIGLISQPNDGNLLQNKRFYELFLATQQIITSLNKLQEINYIDQDTNTFVLQLINKQTTIKENNTVPQINNITYIQNNNEWNIPSTWDYDAAPLNIDIDQLQATIIMIWKQFMLNDETEDAIKFLQSAPYLVRYSLATKKALELTERVLNSKEDNILPEIITPTIQRQNNQPLDIIFYAGNGVEIWTPDTVKKTGIGGSELMLLEQAKRLFALGHKVRVYNSCGNKEGFYDGVEYFQSEKFHDLKCDVLIISRQANMLADQYNIEAKLKLLWVHDVYAINATNELLLKADRILALSKWHKNNMIEIHNVHPSHIITTRNGIDLERFNKKITRNKYKCINSSSPDRSWPILLDVWPKIKEQVPQAELHLMYGFKNWEFSAQHDKGQQDLIIYLKNKIQQMGALGVIFHDRINQEELAREFLSAGCLLYPTWFSETSHITGMEAQAAGVRIITSNIAALKETISNRGVLLNGEWTSPEYQNEFIATTVVALQKDDNQDRIELQKYAKEHFSLDELAKDWEKMFYNLIEELKINPLSPYLPTKPYRKE